MRATPLQRLRGNRLRLFIAFARSYEFAKSPVISAPLSSSCVVFIPFIFPSFLDCWSSWRWETRPVGIMHSPASKQAGFLHFQVLPDLGWKTNDKQNLVVHNSWSLLDVTCRTAKLLCAACMFFGAQKVPVQPDHTRSKWVQGTWYNGMRCNGPKWNQV